MKKTSFSVWFVTLAIAGIFCMWGFWPRINLKQINSDFGNKYKTLGDFKKDFGAPLFKSIANVNEEVVDGYAYVDRFIQPRVMLAVYIDRDGKIIKFSHESLKQQTFYFRENSPFKPLMFIYFIIKENIMGHQDDEMKTVMGKLFPDTHDLVFRKLNQTALTK